MFHLKRIAPAVRLRIDELSSEDHLKACYDSFDEYQKPSDDLAKEMECIERLVYRGEVFSYEDRILWLYCLHHDLDLADLAFYLLPSKHADTGCFELLKPVHQRSFISLLGFRLKDRFKHEVELLSLAESVGHRALSCDRVDVQLLGLHLLDLIDKRGRRVRYLLLEEACIERRARLLTGSQHRNMPQRLRMPLLFQMLIHEQEGWAIRAERALVSEYEEMQEATYVVETIDDTCRILEWLLVYRPERSSKEGKRHYKWKAGLLNEYLTDSRDAVRAKAEEVVWLATTKMKPLIQYINIRLFDYDSSTLEDGMRAIPHTLTRAKIHSRLHPASMEHIEFYLRFLDEELGEIIIEYVMKYGEGDAAPEMMAALDRVYAKLAESLSSFRPKTRRTMVKIPRFCNRYFDHFLQPGLPLHAIDAIKLVDWAEFQKQNTKETIAKAKEYLTRIAKYSNWVSDVIKVRFCGL